MSRTRLWEPKSTKVGTGRPLSPAVSLSSSSSPSPLSSPSPSPARLAYAGWAMVAPATFRYRGLGVEEDQEQQRQQQQQQEENSEEEEQEEEQEAEGDDDSTARTLADEERYWEDREEETEEEEQEAERDDDSTARTLADEERYWEDREEETEEEEQEAERDDDSTARTLADEARYSEDREDKNDEVADQGYVATEDHGYEMPLQLCQDGGSQGEPKGRDTDEEAGVELGRGALELWQEDAGHAAGGVHDLGRDRSHGAVGETRDANIADDYDEEEDEEDYEKDDEDYEEDDKHYEDKDYGGEEEEEEDKEKEEEDDNGDDDLDPRGRGPTEEAVAAARDEASSFMAYFPPEIEDSVIAMTNLEADRRRPTIDGWKPMGRVEFRAYVGLLVLAGVYRSRGEACESLWDTESGRSVFRA